MAHKEQPGSALDRSAREPLWAQLLADLRTRLALGQFADSFPGEYALAEEYEISRHTVREALRRLRSEGTVTAERGRKPRLASAEVEQPLGALTSLFAQVEARGLEQRSIVRALGLRKNEIVAKQLDLDTDAPLVFLERLRLAGEIPLALDQVWLPADLATPLLAVDFSRTALYDELLIHCGVAPTDGWEQIRAVAPTRSERALLKIPAGGALLEVERISCLHNRPLEYRHTLVRGDRYAVTAQFQGRDYTLIKPASQFDRNPA
ncbi:MAG TPA: GntR family transcriptional regulator [Candidatus Nanopelagicaceae bacterium]|nr:GntR family transcriptional regulator [Candidatus Nanopelagicaceae bacterium]